MRRLVAVEHVTLDGVMQGPGALDEDRRDGFDCGGWGARHSDPDMQQAAGARMGSPWSLLVGRRTYEDFFKVWPKMPKPNPFTDMLNRVDKFVASSTLAEPLPWENSRLLDGEVIPAVARLKAEHDKTLVVFGSGLLVRSLMQERLVDEFVLQIHPIVLGQGHRLFEDRVPPSDFKLVDTMISKSGVIVASYAIQR